MLKNINENYVVAEHSTNLGHQVQLQNTALLAKEMRHKHQISMEAIVIELHPDNMNREESFS
jgi:hypothetical protein